jgi:putative peptidoglycan lipid II flippase
VREVVRLMGPRVVTLGAVQFADLFVIRLASGLPQGSTSGYFWGYYLMQLPETLLATAVAIVVFPTLAELYNAGDVEQLKRTAMTTLRIIWTLTIPAAAALILLGRPAIALFFQGGAFDEASTSLVYGVLVFFSLRVVSEGSLEILARLFFAQHDTRTPMLVALGWLGTNVGLAYLLVGPLGIRGLALASTIAFTLQSLILYLIHRRRLGHLYERELLVTLGRSAAGVLAMAAVMLALAQVLPGERSFIANLLYLAASLAAGSIAYAATSFILGGREIPGLLRLIRSPRGPAADLPGPPCDCADRGS